MNHGLEQGMRPTIAPCIKQEAGPMKALMVTTLLLALSAVALAKPDPVERSRLALDNIHSGLVGAMRENIGSVGAMREREYFEAPQSPFNASDFPCRLEPALFNKTRLAQSCR
jgi:hypothetical protein